jgi:uncharacterized protein
MQYRRYGGTDAEVSILSMGGMRFEAPADVDRMAEIPLYLYDHWVNYFDSAPYYCDDKSEDIVGAAVKEMKKRPGGRRFYVASKSWFMGDELRKQL